MKKNKLRAILHMKKFLPVGSVVKIKGLNELI